MQRVHLCSPVSPLQSEPLCLREPRHRPFSQSPQLADQIWAPCRENSCFTFEYTFSTTTTDCSEAQIIPLSKVLLINTELTAVLRSALSSISAGVLPEPTPMAGFPEE